jgi:hypothetical protein
MIFTSSRHLSVGTVGAIAVMIYATIDELESKYIASALNQNNQLNSSFLTTESYTNSTSSPVFTDKRFNNNNNIKLKIAVSLTFWSGIIQVRLFY